MLTIRLGDLRAECPLPTLHAVSAIGTKLCFYHVSSGTADAEILPPAIECDPEFINDTAPTFHWDCDVLEEEGEKKLRAIAEEICTACEAQAVEGLRE